ncbi:hypothetical protein ACSMEV_09630 [Pseudomonas sp. MLB6B]
MTAAPTGAEPAAAPQDPPSAPLPWADAAAEHFQLLRLSPLPTDRHGAHPLRFVQFGHVERHSPAHSLLRLEIRLPGQMTHKEQNRLDVRVDHGLRQVLLGGGQSLNLEPSNRGLGRFLLAQAGKWLQGRWPDYRIESLELPARDAMNDDLRLRRDQVLRSFGLEIAYADGQPTKGHTLDSVVSQLRPYWNEEKVQALQVLDSAAMLQQAEQQLQEMTAQLREREERMARVEREDSGLRFTITCLVAFAVFQAGLLIFIATR